MSSPNDHHWSIFPTWRFRSGYKEPASTSDTTSAMRGTVSCPASLIHIWTSICQLLAMVTVLFGASLPLAALEYPQGQWDVDLYKRGAEYVTGKDAGGGDTYNFVRGPNQNAGYRALIAQTTYVIPSDGRYDFNTGIKNGYCSLDISGVGGVATADQPGWGDADKSYGHYYGEYPRGTQLRLGFHATFGDGSDYAWAKVNVSRVGDMSSGGSTGGSSDGGSTGGGSGGGSTGGSTPGVPAASMPNDLWTSAPSDFQANRYHTKTWGISGNYLQTTYSGAMEFWRSASNSPDVGSICWRTLLVAPANGTYVFTTTIKNGGCSLNVKGAFALDDSILGQGDSQKSYRHYNLNCAKGDSIKVEYAAVFAEGAFAGAKLSVEFVPQGGAATGVLPGGTTGGTGSGGTADVAAAVEPGGLWSSEDSDYQVTRFHTKTWDPSGRYLGATYSGDMELWRSPDQAAGVGSVCWRTLLIAPSDGTWKMTTTIKNGRCVLRLKGNAVLGDSSADKHYDHFNLTCKKGEQVRLDFAAVFAAGAWAGTKLALEFAEGEVAGKVAVPVQAITPAGLADYADSDFVEGKFHLKSWTPTGVYLGADNDASPELWRSQNAWSDVGSVNWRTALRAPEAGTYELTTSIKNGTCWLTVDGRRLPQSTSGNDAITYRTQRVTCSRGQVVKVDCSAVFGPGYYAGAKIAANFKRSSAPVVSGGVAPMPESADPGDYQQGQWQRKTLNRSGAYRRTDYTSAVELSRDGAANTDIGASLWSATVILPGDGNYTFFTNVKNGGYFLSLDGGRVIDGSNPNQNQEYKSFAMSGKRGQKVKVAFSVGFGAADPAYAKLTWYRPGMWPWQQEQIPLGSMFRVTEPTKAVIPSDLYASAATDYAEGSFHTKFWDVQGRYLRTEYMTAAELWRTNAEYTDVGTAFWRTLLVAPGDGVYTVTSSVKNGKCELGVDEAGSAGFDNRGTSSIHYDKMTVRCRKGEKFKVDFTASFGAGYAAGAKLVIEFKLADVTAMPESATPQDFLWGNWHQKIWNRGDLSYANTEHVDVIDYLRSNSVNVDVGAVLWSGTITVPTTGNYRFKTNVKNATHFFSVNGVKIITGINFTDNLQALSYQMRLNQNDQIRISLSAAFGSESDLGNVKLSWQRPGFLGLPMAEEPLSSRYMAMDPEYAAYVRGNHGGNPVLSYEEFSLAFNEIKSNHLVPGYYAAYQTSVGGQALTLIDWFYTNIDAIAFQCASVSPEETVDSDDGVNVPPELIVNNDNARLPLGNVRDGTDSWPFGRHAVKLEYEWAGLKTEPVPFPSFPILHWWLEFPKNKLTIEGNYNKTIERFNVSNATLATTQVNAYVQYGWEGKIKIGRKIEKTSLKFRYYDRIERKIARKYWKVKGELVGELQISPAGRLSFTFDDSVRTENPQQRRVTQLIQIMGTASVRTALGASSSVGIEDIKEYLRANSNSTWDAVPGYVGTGNAQIEVKARGSLDISAMDVTWIHRHEAPDQGGQKSQWTLGIGRVTGAFQVELQLKINGNKTLGYSWSPAFGKLLEGKKIPISTPLTVIDVDREPDSPSGHN